MWLTKIRAAIPPMKGPAMNTHTNPNLVQEPSVMHSNNSRLHKLSGVPKRYGRVEERLTLVRELTAANIRNTQQYQVF